VRRSLYAAPVAAADTAGVLAPLLVRRTDDAGTALEVAVTPGDEPAATPELAEVLGEDALEGAPAAPAEPPAPPAVACCAT
jgi:hypothetical protein